MRVVVVILALLISSCIFVMPQERVKAATYDVNAALAYAQSHWNDGQGFCAEFVSRCVRAGGINISVKTTTYDCYLAICNATGLAGQDLRLNSFGYATYADNSGILAPGDVVIQWCYTHNLRPHILLCGGYDSNGQATFYAHNKALDNKLYQLNVNTSYQHTISCNMGAKVIHLAALSASQPSTAESSIAATDATCPTGTLAKGSSFGIRGVIYSTYSLTNVTGSIFNSSGQAVIQKSVSPNSTSYNLKGAINDALTFNTLSDGDYTYRVDATDSMGYTKTVIESSFVVGTGDPKPVYMPSIGNIQVEQSNGTVRFSATVTGTPWPWAKVTIGNDVGEAYDYEALITDGRIDETVDFSRFRSQTGTFNITVEQTVNGNSDSKEATFTNDATAPTISDIRITDLSREGYTVTCTVSDNVGVTSVRFPTWTVNNDQDDIIWGEGQINGSTASYRVNVSDHNNEVNCVYITHIYVYDAAGNQNSASAEYQFVDADAPIITGIEVSDISEDGYTVTASVGDNYQVDHVDFSVWTLDGEEDLLREKGEIVGNIVTYRVKTSDHGNGTNCDYKTRIYAYDTCGNESSTTLDAV